MYKTHDREIKFLKMQFNACGYLLTAETQKNVKPRLVLIFTMKTVKNTFDFTMDYKI